MPLQNFVDNLPPTIKAIWLNAVDALKFTVFNDATDKQGARNALCSDAPLEVLNGGTGFRNSSVPAAILTFATNLFPVIWQLINPQSADEALAGVTPANYAYPPGNVKRYGATGDGSTDDKAAVQVALNVAQFSGEVFFPKGTFCCSELSLFESIWFHGLGPDSVLQINTNTNFLNIIDGASTFATPTNLTANASAGALSVAVTSAAGLAAGQLVEIYSEVFKFGTSGKNLELNEIVSVVGTTITLKNELIGTYLTANTAALKPATKAIRRVRIENLHFNIPSTMDGGAVIFNDSYDCEIINCSCNGPKSQAGFTFWRSAYCRADGLTVTNGQSVSTPGFGYGFSMGASAHNCKVENSNFRAVRECAVADNVRFSGFVNCESHTPFDNGFNAHALGASDCFFENCRVYFSQSKGFYCGGQAGGAADIRTRFVDCQAHFCNYLAFWSDGSAGVESQDTLFENCRAYNYGVTTATSYGFYVFRSTRPQVINCEVDANGVANARACAKIDTCTEAVVRGGKYRGATSGWGIIHSNCTGMIIDDATIGNIGAAQGVQAEGTPSTKVYVRRNKVDNDTNFTKNTGDIHEYNEFNTKRQNNRGQTAGNIADGGTIAHGCIGTPYFADAEAIGGVTTDIIKVSAVDGTNITVSIKTPAAAAGTAVKIMWKADA